VYFFEAGGYQRRNMRDRKLPRYPEDVQPARRGDARGGPVRLEANLDFLRTTTGTRLINIWEERHGASFFALSVQLECFSAVASNPYGILRPSG
jgi:hypothetical protein